ncbi:MAG TPA: ATP-binding protein [Syntrophorhabdaceae bacterium]|nr:ATP-binding protein [Syntrophorhabdaceae bacterium]HOL05519.1 ATP-binding protein [Syntrophorhabdaceae bacterium]HOT41474.1 ATP-binding protein [Syntrophorhabdaceae bacterium]HRR71223.1 ATP-binding protein [Syntrophorhabdaceae bacterium]HRV21846.1 ATP-binding protein [Syntrophorhabdaceae bacterium]
MSERKIISRLKNFFRSLSLKTQLLLILLFLLLVSISSLTIIYSRTEDMVIEKVTENIDDITKAIQISVEELTYKGNTTERLKSYVDMLNKKGISEISIISDNSEVIASSNPKKIGTLEKIAEKKQGRKKDLIITARMGEESKKETQKLYNVIMPVSIKGQNIGYIHINMILDDYKMLQRKNHIKRILSMLFAFSIGIVLSLLIAEKYTEPIKKVAEASKRIAQGELVKIRNKNRKDEIGTLIESYNEMVEKLAEREELQEKLKKSEQLSIIGQLSSGIAHEIRNPLNFLSLSIGHIKERISESDIVDKNDLIKLMDNITKEIYRVNELIHNFLLLGRPIVLNREWVSVEVIISEAIEILKDKLRKGIYINVVNNDGNDSIYCDREYMRLCLINLIINAIQAITDDEGTITIEYGRDGDYSYITVSDSGKGIPPSEMDRIFEPYYSTKKFGVGLGLTITKRFVEEHGGAITIISEEDKGTSITIKVPYHDI